MPLLFDILCVGLGDNRFDVFFRAQLGFRPVLFNECNLCSVAVWLYV